MLWVVQVMVGLQVQSRGNVHDRESASRESRSRCIQRNQVIAAHQVGCFDQFFNGVIPDDSSALGIG